jgi:hypothetical protein
MEPGSLHASGDYDALRARFDTDPDASDGSVRSRTTVVLRPGQRRVAEWIELLAGDDSELRELDLSSSATYQTSASMHTARLGAAIASNTHIETLVLDNCALTDADAVAIAGALQQNCSLHRLSLRENRLRGPAIAAIVHAVGCNHASALAELELGDQQTGDSFLGAQAVNEILLLFSTNVTLRRIGCPLEPRHANLIQPFLNRNLEVDRRRRLGLRADELMPEALKSDAQKLVEHYGAAELVTDMDMEDMMVCCLEVGMAQDGDEDTVRGRLLAYYNGPSGLASLCGDNLEKLVEFVEGEDCTEVTVEPHAWGAGDDEEDTVVHEQVEEELYWVAVGEEPQELTLEGLIEVRLAGFSPHCEATVVVRLFDVARSFGFS